MPKNYSEVYFSLVCMVLLLPMNYNKIDLSLADLHIHTIASDGEMLAKDVIDISFRRGLKIISITDHDGVGSYIGRVEKLKEAASLKGMELIAGIELDSEYRGVEIHILGYGIDVESSNLNDHLHKIQLLRRKRILEIVDKVNENYGREVINHNDIFPDGRETMMKPHVVRELLRKRLFNTYQDASGWISEKCKPKTVVAKLPPEDIIKIILESGGVPVLAHPAYYLGINGIGLRRMLSELSMAGLAGVEVYYDYHGFMPSSFGRINIPDLISLIKNESKKCELFFTRGSDSHTSEELWERNPPVLTL